MESTTRKGTPGAQNSRQAVCLSPPLSPQWLQYQLSYRTVFRLRADIVQTFSFLLCQQMAEEFVGRRLVQRIGGEVRRSADAAEGFAAVQVSFDVKQKLRGAARVSAYLAARRQARGSPLPARVHIIVAAVPVKPGDAVRGCTRSWF